LLLIGARWISLGGDLGLELGPREVAPTRRAHVDLWLITIVFKCFVESSLHAASLSASIDASIARPISSGI
jgi:hypothetical protein